MGVSVFEYALLTFYPNPLDAAKEKYGIYDLIKYVLQEIPVGRLLRMAAAETDRLTYQSASVFLKSVDFRAFGINVKTIASTQKLSFMVVCQGRYASSGG